MLRLLLRMRPLCQLCWLRGLLLTLKRRLRVVKWQCCHRRGTCQKLMPLPLAEMKQRCLRRGMVPRMTELKRSGRQRRKVPQSQSSRQAAKWSFPFLAHQA